MIIRNKYIYMLVLLFVCHFIFIQEYTLYEDDFFFATGAFQGSFPEILHYIKSCFLSWPQGRPLGFAFPITISWLLGKTGMLPLLYLFGLLIIYANMCLIYKIICRIASPESAFLGAIIYMTFPADTTKILLTHTLQIQPGIFCCLLGILFYTRERVLSYLIASISLLFYETTFLPYLSAVFLTKEPPRIKNVLIHFFIIGCIVLVYALIRASMGESRIESMIETSRIAFLLHTAKNMALGALAGAYGYYIALKDFAAHPSIIYLYIALVFFMGLSLIKNKKNDLGTDSSLTGFFCLLLMIPAAYLLSFTHHPWIFSGRGTSVHIASSVSAAFAGAYFFEIKKIPVLLHIFVIFCIALAAGNSIVVAKSYAEMAALQKEIYVDILNKTKDADSHDCIIIDLVSGDIENNTEYRKKSILPFSWADTIAYPYYILQSVNGIQKPKMISPLVSQEHLRYKNGKIEVYNYGSPEYGKWLSYQPRNILYLQIMKNAAVRRQSLPAPFAFEHVELKNASEQTKNSFPLQDAFLRFAFGKDFLRKIRP